MQGARTIWAYSSLDAVDRTETAGTRSYAATGCLKPNLGHARITVLRVHISTQYHLIGMASMAEVVNNRLRVKGVKD